MPKIIQLDRHVADLIAAGEVVERPASAVKELVENSIDAGAKNITIELQNGGMTFLRITDDGCGMEPVDARTAFLRHATSKIRKKEDLACIGTLGFRGEALAPFRPCRRSILLTPAQGSENGVRLHLEGGAGPVRGACRMPVRHDDFGAGAVLQHARADEVHEIRRGGVLRCFLRRAAAGARAPGDLLPLFKGRAGAAAH